MEVGDRLKKIRQMHGLSQRELAKRVGLTNSTISMIERNTVSPSVSSLKRILGGVSMSLTEFFTIDFKQQSQVVFKADELVDVGGDGVELKLVGPGGSDSQLAFLVEKYAPGSDTGAEMLSHEGEEAGTVIEGSIEITIAGTSYKLTKGDSYKFSTKLPHRFKNHTNKVCKIISAHTPPTF
ncbi:MAG: cupin domain-containing protein [Gammaproteobacteria bacterium]|nr:cupin domain-containing protein [Gammaproteobacteria bacterium]